jgi:hypothetical protein
MANREQRNNREKKKPKSDKKLKPAPASSSPFEQKTQKPAAAAKK